MKLKLCLALFTLLYATNCAWAQYADSVKRKQYSFRLSFEGNDYSKAHKGVYRTWGGNGPLLSFADMKDNNGHMRNIPRFTLFFNLGTNYNYDLGRHFGLFTGLNIKNIGLINKNDSVKLKRRVYTLGVPVGFKIGDVRHGSFFIFGGAECDLAFNYKEKLFEDGVKKKKFNEWFSDRTPLLMPSVFAGFRVNPGFGLKVQYYLNDFFNKDYTEMVSGAKVKPYENLAAKMLFVTLSYDFGRVDYYKHNHKKSRETKVEFNF
jgi:hypothetical protein